MIKRILPILIISLLLLWEVYAMPTRIQILDLQYKESKLSLISQTAKIGYYPDRKIQPKDGYTCIILSENDKILYSFKFKIPEYTFVDVTDPAKDELSGGIVKLDSTEFALTLPYFKEAKSIILYNEKNNEVLSIEVPKEQYAAKNGIVWSLVIVLIVLLAIIFFLIIRKK